MKTNAEVQRLTEQLVPAGSDFFSPDKGPMHRTRERALRQTRYGGACCRSKAIERHPGGKRRKTLRACASTQVAT